MTDIPELTAQDFARAIPASIRQRLIRGDFESGEDVAALGAGRRHPEGPAVALLHIAARHPRIIRENLEEAA